MKRYRKSNTQSNFVLLCSLATGIMALPTNVGEAASFDCRKAITKTEKLICSDNDLSKLDSQMGDSYREAAKSFPIKGFIERIHRRLWNSSCGEVGSTIVEAKNYCKGALDEQIEFLNFLKTYDVIYGNPILKKGFDKDEGIYVIKCAEESCKLMAFGGWLPDMYHPENDFYCDDEIDLQKNKKGYAFKDSLHVVEIDGKKLKARIQCNLRTTLSDEYDAPLFIRKKNGTFDATAPAP